MVINSLQGVEPSHNRCILLPDGLYVMNNYIIHNNNYIPHVHNWLLSPWIVEFLYNPCCHTQVHVCSPTQVCDSCFFVVLDMNSRFH